MMNKIILSFFCCFIFLPAYSQKVEESYYSDRYPDKAQFDSLYYIFDEFTPATIVFRDRTTSRANINIDTYFQVIHFLNEKNDTLFVQNEKDIVYVATTKRYFTKIKKNYFEVLDPINEISLGIKKVLFYQEQKSQDSYGITSNTSATQQYQPRALGFLDCSVPERRLQPYIHTTTYYLIKNQQLYYPTQKSFIKLFPKKKAAIKEIIEKEKLDLDLVENVRYLLDFCLKSE